MFDVYDESNLPEYIKHDIRELLHAQQTNSGFDTDWACELQGSINMAVTDGDISPVMGAYLYKKYLNR